MKIVETLWFTGFGGTVGIVVIEEDVTNARRAYIGLGEGANEKLDTDKIIAWGVPFSLETVSRLNYLLARPKKGGKQK